MQMTAYMLVTLAVTVVFNLIVYYKKQKKAASEQK